jgi:hypothetical protein
MKRSSDTIGDRNRELPVCSAVPQPTASSRVPRSKHVEAINHNKLNANSFPCWSCCTEANSRLLNQQVRLILCNS